MKHFTSVTIIDHLSGEWYEGDISIKDLDRIVEVTIPWQSGRNVMALSYVPTSRGEPFATLPDAPPKFYMGHVVRIGTLTGVYKLKGIELRSTKWVYTAEESAGVTIEAEEQAITAVE